MRPVAVVDNGGNGSRDRSHFGRGLAAMPMAEINDLVLAEPEWRLGAVDRQWNQPAPFAAMRCLIPHPVRLYRMRRPQNDYGIGSVECIGDGLGIGLAAGDQRIPPNGVAGMFERAREPPGIALVLPRIAEEERYGPVRCIRHRVPPRRAPVAHLAQAMSSQPGLVGFRPPTVADVVGHSDKIAAPEHVEGRHRVKVNALMRAVRAQACGDGE